MLNCHHSLGKSQIKRENLIQEGSNFGAKTGSFGPHASEQHALFQTGKPPAPGQALSVVLRFSVVFRSSQQFIRKPPVNQPLCATCGKTFHPPSPRLEEGRLFGIRFDIPHFQK
jgi:hypothetical protein